MTPAQQIARLQEQLDDALYQIRLLKGEPQPFELMTRLKLTKTEAQIVQVLMARGRATKEAIYQVIYSDRHSDEQPGDSLIGVLVCRIRKRLQPHGVTIETLWGVGYAMTPENIQKLRDVLAPPVEPTPCVLDQLLRVPSPALVPNQ